MIKKSSSLTVKPTFTSVQKKINLISHLCKKSTTMSMTIQWIVKLRTANCVLNLQRIFQWATARNSLSFSRCVHIDLMSSHIVKAIENKKKRQKDWKKMNNWIWQKISKKWDFIKIPLLLSDLSMIFAIERRESIFFEMRMEMKFF